MREHLFSSLFDVSLNLNLAYKMYAISISSMRSKMQT